MKMKNKQAEQNAAKLRHKEKLKANRRSQPDLERKEAFLNIKPTILIVCEGKNTEPSYFNHFRLTFAEVVPVGLGFNTISLVNRAIELSQYTKYEQVWCVFDKDDFAEDHFNNSIQRAVANNLNVAYSNQAFEYWLILHFDDHQSGGMHRNDYNDKLNLLISSFQIEYDGNGSKIIEEDFYEILDGMDEKTGIPRISLAINRAERNYQLFDHINPAKEESSTTVFLLAKELLKYR